MGGDLKRIQRTRIKDWRKPPNTKCVGRPCKWGNPYRDFGGNVCIKANRRFWKKAQWEYYCEKSDTVNAISLYWEYVLNGEGQHLLSHLHELKGKDLMCWCSLDAPCHADVLISLIETRIN